MTPTLGFEATLPLLQVRDFSIKERKAKAAPVKVPELDVHDIALSYEKRDVRHEAHRCERCAHRRGARAGRVDRPDAVVWRGVEQECSAGGCGIEPAASTRSGRLGAAASAQSDDGEWRVHADTIQLSEATVLAEDRTVTPVAKFELAPIALTVNGWSTDAAAKVQVDADVTINKKGKLLGKGDVQLDPLSAQLAVELTNFELPAIQPYLNAMTAMTLHSGLLGVKGNVSYAATPESARAREV